MHRRIFVILLALGAVLGWSATPTAQPGFQALANIPASSQAAGAKFPLHVMITDTSGNPITAFGGSGGTSGADDALFTLGAASSITPAGFLVDDTTPDVADEGDAGIARMSPSRILYNAISNQGGTLWATIRDLAANDAVNVALVDGSGNHITSVGGGTQIAVDAAYGAAQVGTAAIYRRTDSLSTLTEVDGDATAGRTNSRGALWVVHDGAITVASHAVTNAGTFATQVDGAALTALQLIDNLPNTIGSTTSGQSGALVLGAVTTAAPTYTTAQSHPLSLQTDGALRIAGSISCSNCSGSGASDVEGSTYTLGTDSVAPLGGYADETSPTAVTEDRIGLARITLQRALHVNPRDSAGNQLFGAAAALADNSANPTIGAIAVYNMCFDGTTWDRCLSSTVTEAVEDAAETAGGVGTYAMTVRRNVAASSAGADGENATANTDGTGLLWGRHMDPCTALNPTTVAISVAADTAVISAGGANIRTYLCGGGLMASTAEVVSIWEGTGTACGTSSTALVGSTTEANGMSFAANGGFTIPTTIRGIGTNVDVCIRLSTTNRVAGWLSYVQVAQ